ncbi:MAG TPA: Fe-Mn family superoxide dismutase [Steroidobacteraceae bacterium]|nr:Fe-Mn family superoxide dismutase [Steroidobacteraceae bacterium]
MTYQVRAFDLSGVQGLSKKAIDLHLGLYKTYVEQLNKLLEQSPQRSPGVAQLALDGYNRRFAFEFNGVALHELFFEQLAGKPRQPRSDGDLVDAIHDDYVDFNGWKASVEALAKTRGVGWVLTLRDRGQDHLYNCWIDLHHLQMPVNCDVVFALDLWEHAYMVDFTPAQRTDYVKIILENVDWAVVEQRCKPVKTPQAAHA